MQNPAVPDQHQKGADKLVEVSDFYAQKREDARKRLQFNRRRIHNALKSLAATHVSVSYAGSGDNGQIHGVSILRDGTEIESDKKICVRICTTVWKKEGGWTNQTKNNRMTVEEALEHLVYDWLESEHPGWEINDGSCGEFTILVATDEFLLNHTTFVSESETHTL